MSQPLLTVEDDSVEPATLPVDQSSQFTTIISEVNSAGSVEKTLYECGRCQNRYARLDHFKRHYRSRECITDTHLLLTLS